MYIYIFLLADVMNVNEQRATHFGSNRLLMILTTLVGGGDCSGMAPVFLNQREIVYFV